MSVCEVFQGTLPVSGNGWSQVGREAVPSVSLGEEQNNYSRCGSDRLVKCTLYTELSCKGNLRLMLTEKVFN